MEPVFNDSSANSTPEGALSPNAFEASPSTINEYPPEEPSTSVQNVGDEDTNAQIVEKLKEQRDQLRGIDDLGVELKPKRSKLKNSLAMGAVILLVGLAYALIARPYLDKSDDIPLSVNQQNFVLPSNLSAKTSEEKQALNIIALARQNTPDEIINTYLNKAHLGQSESDFKALISSYSTSADGEQVELVEKTVGKVDFASTGESSAIAETTAEFEAASLIYKSNYYRHTNNIYLKINLYKPDPTVDSWKMYTFEFKAGDTASPLKADVHIAT